MFEVRFYDRVDDSMLKIAVIISRHKGKWVFCKHKQRETFECPGGHREAGESIEETAKRELFEETGAVKFDLTPVSVYSVVRDGVDSCGMLYFAEVFEFGKLPDMEIEKIEFFEDEPPSWTYPAIQIKLMEKVKEFLKTK